MSLQNNGKKKYNRTMLCLFYLSMINAHVSKAYLQRKEKDNEMYTFSVPPGANHRLAFWADFLNAQISRFLIGW